MHKDTISDLIEHGTSAVGSVLKEQLVHRKEMDRMEAQKDKEIEIAKIRNQSRNDDTTEEVVEAVNNPDETPTETEMEAAIDELIDNEMCAVCQDLLRGLKERSPKEQVIGLTEYGEFKRSLSDEAGVDELKAEINQTTVLKKVLEENLRAPA